MISELHHRGYHYALLIAIASVLFFTNLGGATLWDLDEGRNLTCALEMMESGDLVVPKFNGQLRSDKPALLYWLQIVSFHCFGVDEFAGRFPSALAALGTLLVCYELGRSMFSRTTGLLGSVIAATTPMLCGAARFANQDSLLNLCTVLAFFVFWLGHEKQPWWWFVSLGAVSGLGVLAKGPIGVVLPAAAMMLFLIWERRWQGFWDWRWGLTFWTFVLVAFPWYVWVTIETHGEFLKGFLWTHHVERYLSPMDSHQGFPGYYLLVLLVGTAPWAIFLSVGVWFGGWSAVRQPWNCVARCWHAAAESEEEKGTTASTRPRSSPAAYRLLCAWIVTYCVFFGVGATKLPNYVLPVIVPCALLIGRYLLRWQSGKLSIPQGLTLAGVGIVFGMGVVLSLAIAIASGELPWARVQGQALRGLEPWTVAGLVPVAGAAAGWWFVHKRQFLRYIICLTVTAMAMLTILTVFGMTLFNRSKAPRSLVEESQTFSRTNDIRIACWQLEHLPSLNFYLQRNVIHFEEEHEVASFLKYSIPVYLFMPEEEFTRLQPSLEGAARVVARHHDMYHNSEVVVVTNQR